jgi:hypothetical protein
VSAAAMLAVAAFGVGDCDWRGRADVLPDPVCTPGDRYDAVTNANAIRTICVPGWATDHREVATSRKRSVAVSYSVRLPYFPAYEIDHLISLQLGGSNATANLWPLDRDVKRGARGKDDVEDALHDRVCERRMRLTTAQRIIRTDWRRGRRYLQAVAVSADTSRVGTHPSSEAS